MGVVDQSSAIGGEQAVHRVPVAPELIGHNVDAVDLTPNLFTDRPGSPCQLVRLARLLLALPMRPRLTPTTGSGVAPRPPRSSSVRAPIAEQKARFTRARSLGTGQCREGFA
jgi:hypothetical protein